LWGVFGGQKRFCGGQSDDVVVFFHCNFGIKISLNQWLTMSAQKGAHRKKQSISYIQSSVSFHIVWGEKMAVVEIRCPRCGSPCAPNSQTPNQYTCSHCDISFTFCTNASGRTTIKSQTVLDGARIITKTAPIVQTTKRKTKKTMRAGINYKPLSIYETVQGELQGKSRKELLERFEKLRNFLKQDKGNVEKIYANALPYHFLKYYSVKLKRPCTYKEFLLSYLDNLSQEMTDGELITTIAKIESELRINTDKEIKSAFAQWRKRFTGRQKGRALKTFHEH